MVAWAGFGRGLGVGPAQLGFGQVSASPIFFLFSLFSVLFYFLFSDF
jgi:hypothetical protein